MAACIFCKIIKGDIPSFKLFESERVLAFLDIQPLSQGHALVVPKAHGSKLTDIPDDQLEEILPVAKRLAKATGAENYNILQNNGRLAHQEVDHAHFHMVCQDPDGAFYRESISNEDQIPKPNHQEGLAIGWPASETNMEKLKKYFNEVKANM